MHSELQERTQCELELELKRVLILELERVLVLELERVLILELELERELVLVGLESVVLGLVLEEFLVPPAPQIH